MKKGLFILFLSLICMVSHSKPDYIKDASVLTEFTYLTNYTIADSLGLAQIKKTEFKKGIPPLEDKLKHSIWYKFSFVNQTNENLLIGVTNTTIDSLRVYFITKTTCDSIVLGDGFPFSTRKYKTRYFLADVPNSKDTITVFMKVYLKELTELPVFVGNKSAFDQDLNYHNVFTAFIFGAVLIMVIYNLFIFISTKEITYLFYSISQTTALYAILTLDGYSFQFIWPEYPRVNDFMPSTVALNSIFSTLFFVYFVNLRENAPEWIKFFLGIVVVLFIVIILNFASIYSEASLLYELNTLVSIVFELYVCFKVMQKGYRPARYFIIGYGVYSLAGVSYIIFNLNVLPENFPVDAIIKISLLTEASFLSLALADKLSFFKGENERIIREQNVILERSVKQRTHELFLANQEQETANEELLMLNEELNTTLESIETEKAKSDKLLLNILPESVAGELKEKGRATPKYYKSVTVIFADFVNFTAYAEKTEPEEIIKHLDPLFLSFDLICQKYNLEKIKTIGDCYMAAGGLPIENDTNALDTVKAAIEMLEVIKSTDWGLRIGIHTGPVVAGVIGINKFAYDVWGDAVNIASRMEQSSESNRINISRQTYELVKDHYNCTFRGKIAAKNKGNIEMYFVEI